MNFNQNIIPAYASKTLFADLIMHSESPLRHFGILVAVQTEMENPIEERER